MNRNHGMALILVGVAVLLIMVSISASNQGTTTSAGPCNIIIDFSVYPENHANAEPIIVERGLVTSVPLKVEAPNDSEGTLQMQLTSGAEAGMIEPGVLNAELTQTTVVLSKLDLTEGKVTELSEGRGIRDAGMLTLNPPANMPPGEYAFKIEVRQQAEGELKPNTVSGTLIYITVK